MRLGLLALSLALGSCRVVTLPELDEALRDAGIRTLAVEERFTLSSPYGLAHTRDLSEVVEENLLAVCGTLGVELDEPILVRAWPAERFGAEMAATISSHHLAGFSSESGSGEPSTIVIFVSLGSLSGIPDEQDVTTVFRFNQGGILRHELAHQVAYLHLADAPTWFHEGLAIELEYSSPRAGRLEPQARPQTLGLARSALEEFRLVDVLDWIEDAQAIADGEGAVFREGRPLAHAYMRFLLERRGGSRSLESFRAILDMRRAEHLALEEEWRDWLRSL